jgi:hypothetical protein
MTKLALYPFHFRDPVTGRWVRARHVEERAVIEASYVEFEILGPPEIRDVEDDAMGWFSPWRSRALPRLRYPVIDGVD